MHGQTETQPTSNPPPAERKTRQEESKSKSKMNGNEQNVRKWKVMLYCCRYDQWWVDEIHRRDNQRTPLHNITMEQSNHRPATAKYRVTAAAVPPHCCVFRGMRCARVCAAVQEYTPPSCCCTYLSKNRSSTSCDVWGGTIWWYCCTSDPTPPQTASLLDLCNNPHHATLSYDRWYIYTECVCTAVPTTNITGILLVIMKYIYMCKCHILRTP